MTLAVGAVAARLLFNVGTGVAVLLGTILIVTGPTVIGPMLHHVRPAGDVGRILRWEGILIDPIGAVLAVLVFEAALAGGLREATALMIQGVALAAVVGGAVGLTAAGLIVVALRRYAIPDFLHNAASIAMVVAVFTGANELQSESGFVAVTVMGIALATQRVIPVTHIVEFKENLRVLLISGLFIVLAARLDLDVLRSLGPEELAFIGVLVLVARPLAVALSTLRSGLTTRERAFLAWMAPRGIVAAAISAIFALRLADEGIPGAEVVATVTITVVAATIALYGTTASFVARRLGLAEPNPRGVLIAGAHRWAREIAGVLKDEGFDVLLADTNWNNVSAARLAGFHTFFGSVLSEHALDTLDLSTWAGSWPSPPTTS